MDRTERFYRIQKILMEKKVVTTEYFLKELEISRATFRRDLDYLRDRLGTPIEWNSILEGYELKKHNHDGQVTTSLPGLWLSEQEIYSLLSVIELLKGIEPHELISEHINPIRDRLEKLLAQGEYGSKEITKRIRVISMARRKLSKDLFQCVVNGLLTRKRLKIRHYSRQDNCTMNREISPQRLVYYRDNWYLDAFCHTRDDIRTFSMDTLEETLQLEKTAVSIEDDVLKHELETSYGIFAGSKHKLAKLKFSPFRARWVSKEIWHQDQRGEFQEDGAYILLVPYSDDRELILDILRQGSEVEVVSPRDLRERVRQECKKANDIYS
jgi:predicted DNA-binding transcriptional regulator YafY